MSRAEKYKLLAWSRDRYEWGVRVGGCREFADGCMFESCTSGNALFNWGGACLGLFMLETIHMWNRMHSVYIYISPDWGVITLRICI